MSDRENISVRLDGARVTTRLRLGGRAANALRARAESSGGTIADVVRACVRPIALTYGDEHELGTMPRACAALEMPYAELVRLAVLVSLTPELQNALTGQLASATRAPERFKEPPVVAGARARAPIDDAGDLW